MHGRRKDFFQGVVGNSGFFVAKKIFPGGRGEMLFYALETNKQPFFAKNLTGRCQISKSKTPRHPCTGDAGNMLEMKSVPAQCSDLHNQWLLGDPDL